MTDIAQLGLAIDSRQAVKASADLDRFSQSARGAEKAADGFAKSGDGANTATGRLTRELNVAQSALGRIRDLVGALASVAGVTAFADGLASSVQRVAALESASARLDAVLRSTGNVARTSVTEITALAESMEAATGRSKQEVLTAASQLATFTTIGRENYLQAIDVANDLSAVFGGDLKSNLDAVARALDDPLEGFAMLRKRGFALSESEEKVVESMLKVGNSAGAQAVVLRNLSQQVSGAASASYSGLTKALGDARNAIESLFDSLVKQTGGGAGIFNGITAGARFLAEHMKTIIKLAEALGVTMLTAFGPSMALGAVRNLVAGFNLLTAAMLRNPFTAIATVIAGLIAMFATFRSDMHLFAGESATLGDYMRALWMRVQEWALKAWNAIKNLFGSPFVTFIRDAFSSIADFVKDAINQVIGGFKFGFAAVKIIWGQLPQAIGFVFFEMIRKVLEALSTMINYVTGGIDRFIETVNQKIGTSIGAIGEIKIGKDFENKYKDTGDQLGTALGAAFKAAYQDYVGQAANAGLQAISNVSKAMELSPLAQQIARDRMTDRKDADLSPFITPPSRLPGDINYDPKGSKKISDFEREIRSIRDRTASLQAESKVVGLSTFAAEKMRMTLELENAARKDSIGLTPTRISQIEAEATAYAKAAAAAEEAQEALAQMNEVKSLLNEAFSGFISDIREGVSVIDSLKDALKRLGDRLLQMAIDGAFNLLFKGLMGGMGGMGGSGGGIMGMIMGLFSGGGGSNFGGNGALFANGGIMTSKGALPLNTYAAGGIANGPQMAIFGEGRMNEAYVPLPDGRSIPVTMRAPANVNTPAAANMNFAPQINVQVNNAAADTKADVKTQRRGDGSFDVIIDMISKKVKGEIAQDFASGGTIARTAQQRFGLNAARGSR